LTTLKLDTNFVIYLELVYSIRDIEIGDRQLTVGAPAYDGCETLNNVSGEGTAPAGRVCATTTNEH